VHEVSYSAGSDPCAAYAPWALTDPALQLNRIDESDGSASTWFVIAGWFQPKEFCAVQFGLGDFDPAVYAIIDAGACAPGGGDRDPPGPRSIGAATVRGLHELRVAVRALAGRLLWRHGDQHRRTRLRSGRGPAAGLLQRGNLPDPDLCGLHRDRGRLTLRARELRTRPLPAAAVCLLSGRILRGPDRRRARGRRRHGAGGHGKLLPQSLRARRPLPPGSLRAPDRARVSGQQWRVARGRRIL
jgi:hypothetical protein